jgi:photosystem II stability/assembly factor-like uncharacterized protein
VLLKAQRQARWQAIVANTMGPAEPDGLSPRQRRAVAWVVAAAIVIVAVGFAYLRASPATTSPRASPTAVNPLEVTNDLVSYEFVSPTVAWAIVYPQNRSGFGAGQFWVSQTTDGGGHWQVRLRGQSDFSGYTPSLIRFFNNAHGIVFVRSSPRQFYRTTDGGANWRSISLPDPQATQVTLSDESHGFLLTQPTSTEPVHLFATVDAGDSWKKLPDPPVDTYFLASRRSSEAWLASFGAAPARVYRSVDGGSSWQAHELPYPPNTTFASGSQLSTSVTLLPGSGVVASAVCTCAPTSAFNFATFDGGATWRFVAAAPGTVAYQDDLHWWVIDAKTLYRSADAGQTWTKISDQLPDWGFGPLALDTKHAWAQISVTGGYGLARTDDAGLHWTRVIVPQPN